MRISKTFAGIFLLTFGIGWFAAVALKFEEAKPASATVPDLFSEIAENREAFKNETENLKTENAFRPKVFNVEGFWDETEAETGIHLLETGEVTNGEDFKIRSGDVWLGLFVKNNETKIVPTKIRVKKTSDEDFDWTEFSANTKDEPLFLVKNLPKVKPGKVETLFARSPIEIHEGKADYLGLGKDFYREFKLGDKIFTLRVEEGVSEKDERILVLFLDDGSKSQMLHYIYYSGEGEPVGNLYWAGDLDSDGKLDLFMDFWNYEKGGYSSGLFLSTEAEKGKLVKSFGYFAQGGC